jgi:drug/metabolite transporter (DMT)-like permease
MTASPSTSPRPAEIIGLTSLALCFFAANSLLARAALRSGEIDPASNTSIRLASGALVLALLVYARRVPATERRTGSWLSAAALFLYAAPFSFAYVALPTGSGALILFGVVQLTMIAVGMARGLRPAPLEWLGLTIAFAGLVWLMLPGIETPDPLAALLMAIAGVAWGAYSLRGRGAVNPLAATADNFLRSVVFAAALMVATIAGAHASARGVILACASGAIASGLGYSIWYVALRSLTPTRAAIVQLAVPALTAIAGVLVLGEAMTGRLIVAGIAILGGIAIAMMRRR